MHTISMKKIYPSYRESGVYFVEEELSNNDKKILEDYLKFVGMTAGKRKLEQYRMIMLQLRDVIEKPYDKITKKDAEHLWQIINHDDTRQIATKNAIRMVVKRFLKWFYKDLEMIENLKCQKCLVNTKKFNKSTLITKDELEILLRTANNFRDKAIITLLYESAGRPEEIRKLKWDKVDFMNKTVKIYSSKTGQSREIPIDKALLRLEEWKQDYFFPNVKNHDYIFPSHRDRSNPLTESFFTQLIKRICKRAGIRKITPYDFRRTRLTELYIDKKVPDLIHRKFAGHAPDSKMTAVYVKMDESDMQETIKGLYGVKKLSPEKKHKLEMELDKMQSRLKEMEKQREGDKELLRKVNDFMNRSQKAIEIEIEELRKDAPKKDLKIYDKTVEKYGIENVARVIRNKRRVAI